jgi:hypothetical protein
MRILFFLLPIFLVMSWGADEFCVLAGSRQGSVGPTVDVDSFAVHAMRVAQSLYRHQPCLLMVVFLSYLV